MGFLTCSRWYDWFGYSPKQKTPQDQLTMTITSVKCQQKFWIIKTFPSSYPNRIAFQEQVMDGVLHTISAEESNENTIHGPLRETIHFSVLGLSESEEIFILKIAHI